MSSGRPVPLSQEVRLSSNTSVISVCRLSSNAPRKNHGYSCYVFGFTYNQQSCTSTSSEHTALRCIQSIIRYAGNFLNSFLSFQKEIFHLMLTQEHNPVIFAISDISFESSRLSRTKAITMFPCEPLDMGAQELQRDIVLWPQKTSEQSAFSSVIFTWEINRA